MSSAIAQRVVLTPHPATPGDAVHEFEVVVRATSDGLLTLEYSLRAELSRLRIPAGHPQRADGLWKHTCFEAFIGLSDATEYWEFNFSPALQWAAYRFDAYRQGMSPLELASLPELAIQRSQQRLELSAVLHLPPRGRRRLALAGVIEEDNGRLGYWAGRHPAGGPDFHHPDAYTVEL